MSHMYAQNSQQCTSQLCQTVEHCCWTVHLVAPISHGHCQMLTDCMQPCLTAMADLH